jgi:ribosome-associated toxin RatA of RatAB toxin-antitoxin module
MCSVLMLSAVAAVSAAAPQTEPSVAVSEANGLYTVSASFAVAESAAVAIAALTDYARIPAFMPEVRVSTVLERDDTRTVVEQEATARFMLFSKRIHLLLDVEREPGLIRFTDRCGESFVRYEGAWTIDENDGETRITYELTAKPSFDVPGFLLKRLLKRDASQMIERLTNEIRTRAGRQ